MAFDKETISNALRRAGPPGREDLVAAGIVRGVAACDGYVTVRVHLPGVAGAGPLGAWAAGVERAVRASASEAGAPIHSLVTEFLDERGEVVHAARMAPGEPRPVASGSSPGHQPIPGLRAPGAGVMPGVRSIIAVGPGKGGVGKSTIAVNLAVGLARRGRAVGLMDADIYGPSLPTMLGLASMEQVVLNGRLQPFLVHGVKAITIGKLVEPDKPLIWRGPMAHGAFKQLAEQTAWGELDTLVIDLPPGTGDVSLTMAQLLTLTGAVVVCTPQRVAQDDATRAARMFQQLGIEVLGVVENMSYFVGDDGKEYDIFGRGGAEAMAARLGLPFLGAVPITVALRENSDRGEPLRNFTPGPLATSLERVVDAVEKAASLAAIRSGAARPTLSVS